MDTATRNNATAYGYSVSITAAFAILQISRTDTGVFEIFALAAGAVVAFDIIAAATSGFFREELEDQHSNVKSLAGATLLLFGGPSAEDRLSRQDNDRRPGGLGGERYLDDGVVYAIAVGIELAVAHRLLRGN